MYNTLQIKSSHLLNSGSHEAELATSKLHSYTKYKTLDKEMKRNEKKHSEEMQTLHTGCSKAESKNFARRRPLPGDVGRPKFNQPEMVITFTYRPSLGRIDERNFELSW